jgi:flavodoxin I
MDSMNCSSLRAAIVFASITGNTRKLAQTIGQCFREYRVQTALIPADSFRPNHLNGINLLVIATYTWGNGEIPASMKPIYEEIASREPMNLITAAAGTGDSLYPYYCGAVDKFRDMLFVHTQLAATLKVELLPQESDRQRCRKLAEIMIDRCPALTKG